MKHDLLDAQACIDWTMAQFPAFEERIATWLRENIHVVIVDMPAPCPNDVIVAREKGDLPLTFNVEAGVYVHALRSSLDILACAIGKCEMVLDPEQIYFPFAESRADFDAGNYRGVKFMRQLSATSRQLIEATKPYKGGNDLLWTMHHLDIVRKHKRLFTALIRPASFRISGDGATKKVIPVSTGYMRVDANRETVLGILGKGSEPPDIQLTPCVAVDEISILQGSEIMAVLREFARQAQAIVKGFD